MTNMTMKYILNIGLVTCFPQMEKYEPSQSKIYNWIFKSVRYVWLWKSTRDLEIVFPTEVVLDLEMSFKKTPASADYGVAGFALFRRLFFGILYTRWKLAFILDLDVNAIHKWINAFGK